MKLPTTIYTISTLLLITTAQFTTLPRTSTVTSINPSVTKPANRSVLSILERSSKPKPKKPKEPEKCKTGLDCFWNHHCIDGLCQIGCSSLKDCRPPQYCHKGSCHWIPAFGRPRKCQLNEQRCMRAHHCCYSRCALTHTDVFGYCWPVDRGEDGAPGDEWGDILSNSFEKRASNSTNSDLESRDVDVDVDLEDLAAYLENDGADLAAFDEEMDYSAVEKGKAAYWGIY